MGALDVFASLTKSSDAFARYSVSLVVHDKLIGGIPKDPDTIKKWIESRIKEGADLALQEVINETVAEMDTKGTEPGLSDVLDAVARKLEGGNGFKTHDGELVYEGRCMKAAIKEAANVAFPGTDFPGKPAGIRKGLMRMLAERVFVEDNYIGLGVAVPSGTEQRIKHVVTPQGPRSAISVVDFVEQPKIKFTLAVLDDCIKPEVWGRVWQCAEQIGIGADRARSDGRFDLVGWERI